MTIFRTFDASVINRIGNDPDIRRTISFHLPDPDLPVDFTDCAKRPDDYIILSNGSDAAALFEYRGRSVIDGHSVFDKSCRGRDAIKMGKEMIDWLFANTQVQIITGATPIELRSACWFNRRIGFKSNGVHCLNGAYWSHLYEHFHILRSEWCV